MPIRIIDNAVYSGKVGIGVNSPTSPLHIKVSGSGGSNIFSLENDSNKYDFRLNGSTLLIRDGSNDRVSVTSTGNVGIGTTSPVAKLHIEGTVKAGDSSTGISLTIQSTDEYRINGIDTSGAGWNSLHLRADGTDGLFIQKDTNNVGIGTSSPGAKLDISDSIPTLRITGTRDASWTIGQTIASLEYFSKDSSGSAANSVRASINLVNETSVYGSTTGLAFSTKGDVSGAPSEAMRINASGNVGIGTTSPASKLHVVGADGTYQTRIGHSTQSLYLTVDGANVDYKSSGNSSGSHSFSTGNTERVRITSSGNVGIGTTSPNYALDISKDGGSILNLHRPNSSTAAASFLDFSFNTANATEAVYARIRSDVEVNTDSAQGGDLSFHTANAGTVGEVMRLTQEGNVGIGTTSPVAKLHVVDGSENLYYSESLGNGFRGLNLAGTNPSVRLDGGGDTFVISALNSSLAIWDETASNYRFNILNNGNVGIGTTSPTKKLEVNGQVRIESTNYEMLYLHQGDANGGFIKFTNTDDTAGWYTGIASTEKFIISRTADNSTPIITAQQDGNVGIGTSSPQQKLDVIGRIRASYNTSNYYEIGASSAGGFVVGKSGGVETVNIRTYGDSHFNGGNVGIGTTSPGYKVDVNAAGIGGIRSITNVNGWAGWFENTNNSNGVVVTAGSDSGDAPLLIRKQDGTELFSVRGNGTSWFNNGNVGIGTTSPGVKLDVTGQIRASSGLEISGGNINLVDNSRIRLGAAADLQIYHDGSNSYIADTGTGTLNISSNQINLNASNGENGIQINENADVKIRYNNSVKLQTTSAGVSVTGTATATTFSGDLNGTINTATTAVTKANATNDTTVATTAFVQNLIGTIPAGLVFQGTWDAATNTPTLASGSGTTGHFYIVSTDGSTNLDGITDWKVGDWAVFVEQGATDAWEKVDNSSVLDGSGTGQKVALWSGSGTSNTLTDAPITVSGNNATFAGNVNATNILTVAGAATGSPFLQFTQGGAQKAYIQYVDSGDSFELQSDNQFVVRTGGSTTALTINSSQNATFAGTLAVQGTGDSYFTGNVGIGTTSPGAKLHVVSTGDELARLESGNAAGSPYISFVQSGTRRSYIQLHDSENNLKLASEYGIISFITGDANNETERMRVTSAGNVGIGTTAPQTLLHLTHANPILLLEEVDQIADAKRWGIQSETSILKFRAFNDALTTATDVVSMTRAGNVGIGTTSPSQPLEVHSTIKIGESGVAGGRLISADSMIFQIDSDNNSGTSSYRFRTNGTADDGTELMRIQENGNVGIGTTSPATKLHVGTGSGATVDTAYQIVADGSAISGIQILSGATQSGRLVFGDSGNNDIGIIKYDHSNNSLQTIVNAAERMRITNDGNVGIGTTSPNSGMKLEVVGNIRTNVSNGKGFAITGTTGVTSGLVRSDGTGVALRTSDTDRVTVDLNGKVGIGTTSPANDVSGLHIAVASSTDQLYLERTGSGTGRYYLGAASNSFLIVDDAQSAERMRIDSSGNVGIGTTSPSYKLTVSDGINAGGVVTYSKNYSSLDTTGNAVAGLTTGYNGASAGFTFICFGHSGGYQKIVYSCYNGSGTWVTKKVIDEGTNDFDVEASANATTITFTFKSTSGTKSYTPRVTVEATGTAINSTYA